MKHNTPLPPTDELANLHRRQEAVVEQAMTSSPPRASGAGIVMVVGGASAFANAWVGISLLRHTHHCTLPIQIWHLGPDELSPTMRALLQQFDVELVDAFEVRTQRPMRRLGPWECKAYALLHTPFRHAILLDADNMPLIDPATLLATPQYIETGALFWPDNHSHLPSAPVWRLFDVPYRDELEVESGQIVIDRDRCWVSLNLAVHYNAWSDIYYRYIYGDKETFHFAWHRTDTAYAMPDRRPTTVYCERETPFGIRRMTAALEQADFDGNTVFHHRTGGKWVLDGDNPSSGRQELDASCHQALDELRARWDSRVTCDPPDVVDGREHPAGRCRLRRLGLDDRVITLQPDGAVADTSAGISCWELSGEVITLGDVHAPIAELRRDDTGAWRGRRKWYEQEPIELIPLRSS